MFGEWGGSYIAADKTQGAWGGAWRWGVGVLGRDPNRQRRTIQKTANRIGYCLASSLVSGSLLLQRIMVRRTVAVGVRLTIADRALACALPFFPNVSPSPPARSSASDRARPPAAGYRCWTNDCRPVVFDVSRRECDRTTLACEIAAIRDSAGPISHRLSSLRSR